MTDTATSAAALRAATLARLDAVDRLAAAASDGWGDGVFGVTDGLGRQIFSVMSTRGDIDDESPNACFAMHARADAPWLSATLRAVLDGAGDVDRSAAARRLEEIRRRVRAAAPGPWSDDDPEAVRGADGRMVLRVLTTRGDYGAEVSDAQFAAAMRTEIPWMADVLGLALHAASKTA